MKMVVIIGDGMADQPVPELDGRTPLEAAYAPHMHLLARRGITGLARTCYPGLPVESAVANLGILGFDPRRHYPGGRASFEALARGIALGKGDLAFRCNLVSVDGAGRISDFTAAQISDADALLAISHLSTDGTPFELYSGQSYRNLLVVRNSKVRAGDLTLHPPHQNIGRDVREVAPEGRTPEAKALAKSLWGFLQSSAQQLRVLNRNLRTRADMCWAWSPSEKPFLPSFLAQTGIRGAVVCGIDTIRGIGIAAQMRCEAIAGATGYSDSNLRAKGEHAIRYLGDHDFVFVHVNAPDEESHRHSVAGKVASIERIDREIVGPVVEFLNANHSTDFRVVVMPDHFTLLSNGQHKSFPVPFVMFGAGIESDRVGAFSEREIKRKSAIRVDSVELIKLLRES